MPPETLPKLKYNVGDTVYFGIHSLVSTWTGYGQFGYLKGEIVDLIPPEEGKEGCYQIYFESGLNGPKGVVYVLESGIHEKVEERASSSRCSG